LSEAAQHLKKDYTYRALILAVMVEVVSCIGIYGDKFSRTTAEVLVDFHLLLNLPVYCLLYLLGIGPVIQVQNGCLRLTSAWCLSAISVQCCTWTWLFLLLMRLEQRWRQRRSS